MDGPSQPNPPHPLVARWEGLPPHVQFISAYVVAAVLLLLFHLAFFQRITVGRSIGYAVFEAIPLAGLVVLATQTEIRRRGGEPPAE